ncbi:MAG: malonyl-CoA synthase [Gammaproteobacteria bacterium]|nr:malonyl-CoA synthase [Gammaproteobacteria bacterium]MDH5660938.1 malonyl-CoA synthase [Gammaproteobacteria bacterium]
MNHYNTNIYSIFENRFPKSPDAVFIETTDGTHYSYAYLQQETARIANFLTQQGVKKGDRVAVQVEKSPHVLFLYLACLRAGFVYLPLNTAYTKNELSYFLENAEPTVVVCSTDVYELFSSFKNNYLKHIYTLDTKEQGSLIEQSQNTAAEFETVACDTDDIAVILYTSGTTGRPKGAMITHGNLAANGLALQEAWNWQQSDVMLHALPIFHIHGLFVACHNVLLGGSKMLFLEKFDCKTIIQLLPKATVFMGVPTFYTRLLDDENFNSDVCQNMRLFISGSAPLLEQTFEDFQKRTGHTILERYGMTETGMNTSNPVDGERLAGTVGLPLPGVQTRIVDENNHTVENNQVGILQVKGDNVFKGYWGMPEKTAEEFTDDHFFITGDMATCNDKGYISIVGRNKDMVITGGYNVYPKEVELLLDESEGVKESAVIGLAHKDFGEAVTAIVVADDVNNPPDADKLRKQLKEQLASYKTPKKIIFIEQLPRNTMGKVQKNILRETYKDLYQ